MHVAVIGGGAAGFFAALSVKEHYPKAQVTIYEKSGKLLSKVRISGGGRCNVTHQCLDVKRLSRHYPRGEKFLRKAFPKFNVKDTIQWFEKRGVRLRTEGDGRMFPETDDSRTIIECLMNAASGSGVRIEEHNGVTSCMPADGGFELLLSSDEEIKATHVIVATGGSPKPKAWDWLKDLGHVIIPPVPSLFTFNMPEQAIRELMGVVADPVRARITGTDLESNGPLLITHWGMSGPAILKLSAWGARVVHGMNYEFTLQVNWLGTHSEEEVRAQLIEIADEDGRRKIGNIDDFGLPRRLWQFLLTKAAVPHDRKLAELAKKDRNRLIDLLTNDRYPVRGKTTFKEEFVTAGGVSLHDVDPLTMRSRKIPGMYFAGEVLDIDGITGGFNFQAAWTSGHIAGRLE